jgi:hypothetical protein
VYCKEDTNMKLQMMMTAEMHQQESSWGYWSISSVRWPVTNHCPIGDDGVLWQTDGDFVWL